MTRSVLASGVLPGLLVSALVLSPGCAKKPADAPTETDKKAEQQKAPEARPGDGALCTDEGIHIKVVPTRRDLVPSGSPGGAPSGTALSYFRPYFVHAVRPDLKHPTHYQVADSPDPKSVRGWVTCADVFRWDTRIGMRGVGPVTVFPSYEGVVEVLKTGFTKEKAIARTYGPAEGWLCFPTAESRKVQVNGVNYEVVHIYFLAAALGGAAPKPPGPAPYTPEEKKQIYENVVTLDLAFLCDGTASTTPFQTIIRAALNGIATQASGLGDRAKVAYGLTVYTDHVKSIMFRNPDGTQHPTRVVSLAQGLQKFKDEVSRHHPATDSSEDYAEAGYDGLLDCMNQKWSGSALSERVVVWISDNSLHEPGHPKNPRNISAEQVIALAKKNKVRVYALAIRGADDADQAIHMRQCKQIAEGTGGEFIELRDHKDVNAIAGKILNVYRARTNEVGRRGAVVEGLGQNRPVAEIKAELKMNDAQWSQVMEYLVENRVDPTRFTASAPGVASGWAVIAVNGRPVLRPEVFISRRELGFLNSELNKLVMVLDDAKDRENLVKLSFDARIGYRSFFEKEHGERMSVWYAKQRLPVSGGVLNYTQEELLYMPEKKRQELKDKIRGEVIPRLSAFNSNNRSFVYFDKEEFAWLEESLLP